MKPREGDARNEARAKFEAAGLSYSDITEGELLMLVMILNRTFKKCRKDPDSPIQASMTLSKKMQTKWKTNGTLNSAFLFMNGPYFKMRECISFNEDGFIGFCGWADDYNAEPVACAFEEWVDMIRELDEREAVSEPAISHAALTSLDKEVERGVSITREMMARSVANGMQAHL